MGLTDIPRAPLPPYEQIPETKHDLDWADLATLDLSQFDAPGGKEKLAQQLFDAIQRIGLFGIPPLVPYPEPPLTIRAGFFYIVNFGFTQEEVDRQFAIGKEVFNLPLEEKLKYRADLENGGYNGYKPAGLRELVPGKFDNTEIYNIPKFTPDYIRPQPSVITTHEPEIRHFATHIHNEIIRKLLVLLALILELPEDTFLANHRYDKKSDCHLRYMKYHRRTAQENAELGNVWSKGHTDFGSLTLLFRQPVAALQVRTPEGEWKWVKPYPGSITVNLADSLDFLTNGFLKSSIHRVVAPPEDQMDVDRLGVLYFVRPEDDLELRPVESETLKRLGFDKVTDNSAVGVTAGEWVKARVAKNVNRAPGGDAAVQNIVGNVKARYYS
ncbi:hypothetical protein FQN55_003464 [Onygenales sp. PD_40]|nr:hypothetical protein FQN55_003464 [Onygenales sp. PD_40]